MTAEPIRCEDFEAEVDDLALGVTAEPRRAQLLAHAASCAACTTVLRDLSTVVDGLLELATAVEPPIGFEQRTLARLRQPPATPRVPPRGRQLAAAAALLVVAVAAGVGLGRWTSDDGGAPFATAPILRSSGEALGTVEIAERPIPRLVVTLARPMTWRGTWTCEVRAADGSWIAVGRWEAGTAPASVWAAPVDEPLLGATAMRITGESGSVIGTADLT